MTPVNIGDWISFYQSGKLVIGEVRYKFRSNTTGSVLYGTDIGTVMPRGVLEVRKAVKQKETNEVD